MNPDPLRAGHGTRCRARLRLPAARGMTRAAWPALLLPGFALWPLAASAHAIGGRGFEAGLLHPVFGLDHLLAMLAVGIVSVQIGGRAVWSVPATFVCVMLAAGAWGMQGLPLPLTGAGGGTEFGIRLSVVALGLVIALGGGLDVLAALPVVAFFAVFHGYAHGIEMPALASPWLFASGFACGTIAIHLAGVAIGFAFKRGRRSAALLRYGGATVFGMGLQMLAG